MDVSKIIRGIVNSRGYTITSAITQWDYGYVFVPEFDDLPATYRLDGTFGNSVKAYESEAEALKEFFRQAGQAVDTTHLTDSVTMLAKEGFELRHEVFMHDVIPVEEETEQA